MDGEQKTEITSSSQQVTTDGEKSLRLVQCTECETRFGLPLAVFQGFQGSDPELHCSKCGSLFSLRNNPFFDHPLEFLSEEEFQSAYEIPLEHSTDSTDGEAKVEVEGESSNTEVTAESGFDPVPAGVSTEDLLTGATPEGAAVGEDPQETVIHEVDALSDPPQSFDLGNRPEEGSIVSQAQYLSSEEQPSSMPLFQPGAAGDGGVAGGSGFHSPTSDYSTEDYLEDNAENLTGNPTGNPTGNLKTAAAGGEDVSTGDLGSGEYEQQSFGIDPDGLDPSDLNSIPDEAEENTSFETASEYDPTDFTSAKDEVEDSPLSTVAQLHRPTSEYSERDTLNDSDFGGDLTRALNSAVQGDLFERPTQADINPPEWAANTDSGTDSGEAPANDNTEASPDQEPLSQEFSHQDTLHEELHEETPQEVGSEPSPYSTPVFEPARETVGEGGFEPIEEDASAPEDTEFNDSDSNYTEPNYTEPNHTEPNYTEQNQTEPNQTEENSDGKVIDVVMQEHNFGDSYQDLFDLAKKEQAKKEAELAEGESPLSSLNAPSIDPNLYSKKKDAYSSGYTTLFFAGPLIGFVLVLLGFSEFIKNNNNIRGMFDQVVSQSLPTAAPAGIHLEGLKFKKVPLLSGETAYLLEGMLINRAGKAFSKAQIEGVLFDTEGKIIARRVLAVGRPLDKRMQFPSTDAMLSVQEQQSTVDNVIKAADQRRVTIFFGSREASEAQYYTARLFSVSE